MTVHNRMQEIKSSFYFQIIIGISAVAAAVWFYSLGRVSVHAEQVYTNTSTGYSAYIEDDAGLLTDAQRTSLAETMQPLTAYENIAFCSTGVSNSGTASYARAFTESRFSGSTGSVFLIDMYHREIYIDSYGAARRRITSSYAYTITDNVYSHASSGDYYQCAAEAFDQMYTLFEGGRIAQPMKYASNLLLALAIALFFNFLLVMNLSRKHKPARRDILEGLYRKVDVAGGAVNFQNQTRTYHPPSSSGGGGGSHGGGGGGGGGHSGGGHSF